MRKPEFEQADPMEHGAGGAPARRRSLPPQGAGCPAQGRWAVVPYKGPQRRGRERTRLDEKGPVDRGGGAGARGRGLLSLRHRAAMQAQEQAFLVVIAKEWRAVGAGAAAQVGGHLGQNHFGDEGQIEAAHLAERDPLQM